MAAASSSISLPTRVGPPAYVSSVERRHEGSWLTLVPTQAEVTIDNFQSDFNLTIWAADDGSTPSSSHFKWHDEVAPGYSSHIMFQNLSAMYDISVVVDNGNSASPAWIAATTHIYYADDETRKAESERLRSLKAARDAQQE